jgi:hypothetical protein
MTGSLLDKDAIRELLYQYCFRMDQGRFAELAVPSAEAGNPTSPAGEDGNPTSPAGAGEVDGAKHRG